MQDLTAGGPILPIINDIDARFFGDIVGDAYYVLTNWQAPNGRVLKIDLKQPRREDWKEIIATKSDSVLDGITLIGGRLFVNYLHNVTSVLKEFDTNGTFLRDVKLPGLGTASGPYGQWKGSEAFYTFSSFATPGTIFRYDTVANESCGKCTPCREGTRWLVQIFDRIIQGGGKPGDVELIQQVAGQIDGRSFCPLGDAAAWPILAAIRVFPEEFEYFVKNGHSMVDPRPVMAYA